MAPLKYKLVKTGILPVFYDALSWDGEQIPIYRIKALRDIPEHGVKSGDLGGYVSGKMVLSQEGTCWIGGDAKALGSVSISEDAFLGDIALVICPENSHFIDISGNAKIKHSAVVSFDKHRSYKGSSGTSVITGDVTISGSAHVANVDFIDGKVTICDYTSVTGARQITGEVRIMGKACIEQNVTIAGKTLIMDNAVVEYGATVVDSVLSNNAQVYAEETVQREIRGGYPEFLLKAGSRLENNLVPEHSDFTFEHNKTCLFEAEIELRLLDDPVRNAMDFADIIRFLNGIMANNGSKANIYGYGHSDVSAIAPPSIKNEFMEVPKTIATTTSPADIETADALNLLAEIKAEFHTYESDIVKIISYPVMTDKTDPFTLDMVAALKLANRLSINPSHKGFVTSVFDLEKKFMAAEANALRVASTRLSDADKRKTEKAKDLFAMAADEASTENEKELAFSQGFKALEGIILVPDIAVDTFRVKIGLRELESLNYV
jgi:carbonic anhydrase/acetyltransferase-like protein (isoleucine patch superfamily)